MPQITYRFVETQHTTHVEVDASGLLTIHGPQPRQHQLSAADHETLIMSFPLRAFEQGRNIEDSALTLGYGDTHLTTRSPMFDDPVYQRFLTTLFDLIDTHLQLDIRPSQEASIFTTVQAEEPEQPIIERLNKPVIAIAALCTIPAQWLAMWLAKKVGAYFVVLIGPFGILLAIVLIIAFTSVITYASGYIVGHRHDVPTSQQHALFVGALASVGTFILLLVTGTFWWPMLIGLIAAVYLAQAGGLSADRQKFLPF